MSPQEQYAYWVGFLVARLGSIKAVLEVGRNQSGIELIDDALELYDANFPEDIPHPEDGDGA